MSQAIKKAIVGTAEFYGRQISENVLGMYYEDLCDLPEDKVLDAYRRYRRNPANKQNPLPAQIRELVNPDEFVAPETKAREVAARVVSAIPKFGWNNGLEAQVFIGPEGWDVVQRQGGWAYLCEHVGLAISPTTLQAQIRDQLIGEFKHGKAVIEQSIGAVSRINPRTGSLVDMRGIMSLIPGGDEPDGVA